MQDLALRLARLSKALSLATRSWQTSNMHVSTLCYISLELSLFELLPTELSKLSNKSSLRFEILSLPLVK